MKKLMLILLLCFAVKAQANYVAGQKIEETIQLDNHALILNGAGIRAKFIVDVYTAALYLSKKVVSEEELFADHGPKRISLHMLRDVGNKLFIDGLNASILANHTEAEMVTLDKKVDTMMKIIASVHDLKKHDEINLDYIPGLGTRIVIKGAMKGVIEGEDFNRALLRIWLGKKPVHKSLKKALLGQEDGK